MPGRKCILCGKSSLVTNKEGSNTTYFSFPRDENLRKKWIDVCHSKLDNIISARICSDHFKEEDFLHKKSETEEGRKKRLKCNVVPSLYLEERGGKQSRNNINIKNSIKENSKDCLKKRDHSRDTENKKDQHSILQSRKKSSSGIKTDKYIRDLVKKKSIYENNKHPNLVPKQKNIKGLNNKENSKESIRRKIHFKNTNTGIKKLSTKKSEKELLKKKKKSLSNISLKKGGLLGNKITKKSLNKENQMEAVEEKFNNIPSDALEDISKEKLTRPMIIETDKKEVKRKKNHPEINSKDKINIVLENSFPDEEAKHETSVNVEKGISPKNPETKNELESYSRNVAVTKKTVKRKRFIMDNGISKRIHKKRIRLGKDDSEDSEDSSSECNNLSRDKITYKSSSEMADNVDLLKYLNYLKEKSRSSDQPILFWVDD